MAAKCRVSVCYTPIGLAFYFQHLLDPAEA